LTFLVFLPEFGRPRILAAGLLAGWLAAGLLVERQSSGWLTGRRLVGWLLAGWLAGPEFLSASQSAAMILG